MEQISCDGPEGGERYGDGYVRRFNGTAFPHHIANLPHSIVLSGTFINGLHWKSDPVVIRSLRRATMVSTEEEPFISLIPIELCAKRSLVIDYFLVVGLVRSRDIIPEDSSSETDAAGIQNSVFKAVMLVLTGSYSPKRCLFGIISDDQIHGQRIVYRVDKELVFFFPEFRETSSNTTYARTIKWTRTLSNCMLRIQRDIENEVKIHGFDIREPSCVQMQNDVENSIEMPGSIIGELSNIRVSSANVVIDQAIPNMSAAGENLQISMESPGDAEYEVVSSDGSDDSDRFYEELISILRNA